MKPKILYLLIILTLLLPLTSGCTPQASTEKLSFSIVTGGTGGVWYPLGGALGGMIGKYVPNTEATSEATTAAIDNLKLLVAGKAGMAFAYDYHSVWLNEGKLPAVTADKKNVRVFMSFYEQPLHIATKEGTGIKTLMDLKGKRVSTGAPNSGTEEQADYVFKGLGMDWNKDITREKLGAAESVAALKDGKIDALFWSGAVPTAAIVDLGTTPGLKMVMLPISGEVADKIIKANPAVFHKTFFKKGSYPGIDADVETLGITAIICVMDTFNQDRLYQITKAVFENKGDLVAVWKDAANLTPELSINQMSPEAVKLLHPGSAKYFKEKGALK